MKNMDEIGSILNAVLGKTGGYEASALYYRQQRLATRFADNAITQNLGGSEEYIRLTLGQEGRRGSASTNKLDADSLASLIKRAEAICGDVAPDPEYMPPLPQQEFPQLSGRFCEETASLTPADLAARVGEVAALAAAENYRASGIITADHSRTVLANSAGLHASDDVTEFKVSSTMHGPKGSGHGSAAANLAAKVDLRAAAGKALATAIAAQNPVDIKPGDYDVIFEPGAVWSLLLFLAFNLDAREAEEGVSAFTDLVGEKVFDERVNLGLRLDDPNLSPPPFALNGLATRPVEWVRDGILQRLNHTRYWAGQKGVEADPEVVPLYMAGEDRSTADLIANCERGLLVKRLWYIRYVDRKELLLTGMTRDGLFRIEDGRVVEPVKNLRFNESPLVFLKNVCGLSRTERVDSWEKAVVPAVMSREFTFDSKTESL
ncbi:MAG: TldD/PmbA family protein [bacterium]|nr:TldD/PmbA family protein [bacterium]